MKLSFNRVLVWLGVVCLLISVVRTHAFALLGPVQPWMQITNGVVYSYDIGGPMDITNEYRWNVPVVTYGFDKSFLDFFGTNGVAAVQSAIQVLNDLPPASSLVLSNYPFVSIRASSSTQAQSLVDLKSQTLSLLLEQLGLAQPTRNIYVIKSWDPILLTYSGLYLPWYDEETNDPAFYDIAHLNFDPQSAASTAFINGTLYSAQVIKNSGNNYVEPFSVDPLAPINTAVTEFNYFTGCYYTGLTYDDIGGLHYLLSTNNINYENLLSGVQGIGPNSNLFVNGAWRPGVDKITFVLQPVGSLAGTFLPMTNQFTDTCITNGVAFHQQLQRVTLQPDFLFSAGADSFSTGTTNWINNAALNNNPAGAGPGIIQPPVVITCQKMGGYFYSLSSGTYPVVWSEDSVQDVSVYFGTFDGPTNMPIVYPAPQTGNVSMVVRVLLSHSNALVDNYKSFEWSPTSQTGTVYALQTSTNLSTWNTLFVVTNNGSVCTYQNVNANSSSRFYRLTPQ